MMNGGKDGFDPGHMKRWWETTRHYLFADLENLPGISAHAGDGWSPPQTDSRGGRKRYLARARGRLMRSIGRDEQDDPMQELEGVFQRQISFIASHPDVPRCLLSWLAQDRDPGIQRRVRMLIDHYAARLARIIARAGQRGMLRAGINPNAAAIALVGVIQGLVLGIHAVPQQRERFLREAAEAFALYRARLAFSAK